MTTSQPDNLFVANLQTISIEELVTPKINFFLKEMQDKSMPNKGASLHKVACGSFEKALIKSSLEKFNGNQTKTAQVLGINRNTLKKRIDTYSIKINKSAL